MEGQAVYRQWTYNNMGIAAMRQGKMDLAIECYTKALKIQPKFSFAYLNRGSLYHQLGNTDLALIDYDKVVELDAHNSSVVRVYVLRAQIKSDQGKYEEALGVYTRRFT